MNPFLNKSPAELLAMVPDLADPELDALCAKYCDGWEYGPVDILDGGHLVPMWSKEPNRLRSHSINQIRPSYTSDPREAMRLLVKYRFSIHPHSDGENLTWCANWPGWDGVVLYKDDLCAAPSPCRAITEAAVVCELTRMIEGDGDAND